MTEFDNSLKIGILGGGQLGKMLIQSALDLDLEIHSLDGESESPCSKIAHYFTQGSITDYQTVYNWGKDLDVITIEIENVSVEALHDLQKLGKKVFPQPEVIEIIKDKVIQKQFFKDNGIATADFVIVNNQTEISNHISFLPAVNKLGVGGYDGKGVQILRNEADIEKGFEGRGILEKLIDFEKELAVIIARSESGKISAFPVVEMVFHPEANLVEYLFSPASISPEIETKAIELAKMTAEKIGIVGLLAVELFLTKDGEVLVNEVAPRPHNSGHQTQKGNFTSQFDQHLRAILDLPFGNTDNIMPSAMVNLLGEAGYEGAVKYKGLERILSVENIFPFFYGKKITKPYRKMGHVTILDSDFDKLTEKVNFVKENLKVISK
jgi:5-(carboxyamino)imidazole ribonucleotide synthase